MDQAKTPTASTPTASTPTASTPTPRTPTQIDSIAEEHVEAQIALSPTWSTVLGRAGADERFDDFSPAGFAEKAAVTRSTLARLEQAQAVDAVDAVTLASMRDRLGLELELHEQRISSAQINVIASHLVLIREVIDAMPRQTPEHWSTIAARLRAMPMALTQWQETLTEAADHGWISPARQFADAIDFCRTTADPTKHFSHLLTQARSGEGDALASTVLADLERAIETAAQGFTATGEFLRTLAPRAPERDAIGRELYPLVSHEYVGDRVDLEETYAWGQEELARIEVELAQTAERITPGASLAEAIAALKADPDYVIDGTDALREWMQQRADDAIAALAETHFDIPEPLRHIDARIAPSTTGSIYYLQPSDDFARPGSMWWAVPEGVTRFDTWNELTTVFHEGVPGHHLQIGHQVYLRTQLNSWRRLGCWISGHGEGWALYAERLMGELGFLDDPGHYLGMLDAQALRAARVVLDIGVHCELPAPPELGGGAWTYDKAWQFLTRHVNQNHEFLRAELHRYLGWPGQAPSYKIGERLWLQLRADAAAQAGAGQEFSLRDFHRRALDIGSVPMSVLRQAILG